MGKKRKAAGQPFGQPKAKEIYGSSSKLKKLKTYEDVADEEDEFLSARDKLILQGTEDLRNDMLELSDEEVFAQESEDSDELEEDQQEDDAEEADSDDYDDNWGTSKNEYYGADTMEGEDAIEEEAEARRLQQKKIASFTEADYGLDEWIDREDSEEQQGRIVTEVLPQLEITEDMSSEERMRILRIRFPDFDQLSKDLVDLHPRLEELNRKQQTSQNALWKWLALSTYLGCIGMYFALLTSRADHEMAVDPLLFRDHPIHTYLRRHRIIWEKVKDISEEIVEVMEESDMSEDQIPHVMESTVHDKSVKKPKKSRVEKVTAAVVEASIKRREARIKEMDASLASLDSFLQFKPKKAPITKEVESDSDIGEEAHITVQEAALKSHKKKSLQFYTSQIAQKANKRDRAGRHAGGDDDLPYRERHKDRMARLNLEAERRGKGGELGDSSDDEDHKISEEVRADDYYDFIAAKTANKKKVLEPVARVENEEIGGDGKRKISYAIEKNKGLTPKRKKDVRNPRVKKRKKFDERKKKLASMRQIYKGGEERGGYGGERTGIKKSLVKSVRL